MSKFKYLKRFVGSTALGAAAGAFAGVHMGVPGLRTEAAKEGALAGGAVGALAGLPFKPILKLASKGAKTYAAGAAITPGSKVGSAVRGYKGAVRFIRRHGRIIPIRAK